MKVLSAFLAILLLGCFAARVDANEEITCKSPDGRFALRYHADGNPAIVETRTHQVAADLVPDDPDLAVTDLLWSADSQRVACFNEAGVGATRVLFRASAGFEEIQLPNLPDPNPPAVTPSDTPANETNRRLVPIAWLKSGDLVLENEFLIPAWGRAALEITIGFDQERRASIRKAEPQETSIIDYFAQLPPRTLEDTALKMLGFLRRNGTIIDKKNGYIQCKGDGAQGDFEVALFRYRDRRPLLVVSTGSTEGEKGTFLQFFEAGADGAMHKIADSVFPMAGAGRDEDGGPSGKWQFDLPRYGKTILVRNPRSGKVVHRITWNGETFQNDK
ncbi:MAG: hypothetical protein WAO00_00780 [Chthoniobacterales bacterium]